MTGTVGRLALVLIGAAAAWAVLDRTSGRDITAQRRALDARAAELAARALTPGSPLACLDAIAGEAVEASCEKALFATPETTAAAVSYVAAQLALLADGADYARRDPGYEAALAGLRHAAEFDRFGIVAHVLTIRDGCTPDRCNAFSLLRDPSRVTANLSERLYDAHVVRHTAAWPAGAGPVVAGLSPPSAPSGGARVPANLFLPSAASIPAVSIMNVEPSGPSPQPVAADPAAAKPPAQARKQSPQNQQQARRPTAAPAPTSLTPPAPRAVEAAEQ